MLRRVNCILKSLGATEGKGVSGSGNGEVGADSGGMGGVGMARLTDHWNLVVNEGEGAENRP